MNGHIRPAGPVLALAAAVVGIATAGCGAAGVSNAIDPVAKAATISNATSGYRMNLTMRIAGTALPNPITASGTGSFTPAAHTGQMRLAMNFSSIPQVAQMLGSSTLTMRELIDRGIVYLGLPRALTSRLPGHRPWIELDLAKLAASQGIPGASALLSNPTSSNPAQMLQYLKAASGGVRKLGTASIGGRPTTEYHAVIDLSRVPDVVPPADRVAARQAIAALERSAQVKRIPVDVWVDAQHLVRQMRMQFAEHLAATGQAMNLAMTLDIPVYGPQPAPSFPSASQVTSASSLLGGTGASGTA